MQTNFLDEYWAHDLRSLILSSTQPASKSISQWTSRLQKKAKLLNKTTYQISNEHLLDHFETNLPPPLLSAYRNDEEFKKVRDLNDIKKWTAAAVCFENRTKDRLREWEEMAKKQSAPIPQSNSNPKCQNTDYCSNMLVPIPLTSSSSTSAPATSGSGSNSNPSSCPHTPDIGGLSNSMKDYLDKHRGCRKCCHTNVDHCSVDCTLGFPDPTTYRGIMLADGVTLAPDTPSLNSVVSVSVNSTHISSRPVAVITSSLPVPSFPPTNNSSIIGNDNNLSVDSDNEVSHASNHSVSLPPPFSKVRPICPITPSSEIPFAVDHLVWPCAIFCFFFLCQCQCPY